MMHSMRPATPQPAASSPAPSDEGCGCDDIAGPDEAGDSAAWFIRSFGELYPLLYSHRSDEQARTEAAQIAALLGLTPSNRLLDICCGTGRHTQAFLRMGLDVIGMDLSEALLRQAAARPHLAHRLVRADIRAVPFHHRFDAAVNLFTSFGYFSEHDNARALISMVASLRRGGLLLMDLPNPDRLRRDFEPVSRQTVGSFHLCHERRWVGPRITKRTIATDASGQRHVFHEDVRIYEPDQITALARQSGLSDVRLLGSLVGDPLSVVAPRLIVIGRRS
jgi:SAM-dependent methyltransferase